MALRLVGLILAVASGFLTQPVVAAKADSKGLPIPVKVNEFDVWLVNELRSRGHVDSYMQRHDCRPKRCTYQTQVAWFSVSSERSHPAIDNISMQFHMVNGLSKKESVDEAMVFVETITEALAGEVTALLDDVVQDNFASGAWSELPTFKFRMRKNRIIWSEK